MSSMILFVGQLGDALDELGLVDLVGNLGDDDRLFFLGHVFERGWARMRKRPRPVL